MEQANQTKNFIDRTGEIKKRITETGGKWDSAEVIRAFRYGGAYITREEFDDFLQRLQVVEQRLDISQKS